jgi:hypothetical protein
MFLNICAHPTLAKIIRIIEFHPHRLRDVFDIKDFMRYSPQVDRGGPAVTPPKIQTRWETYLSGRDTNDDFLDTDQYPVTVRRTIARHVSMLPRLYGLIYTFRYNAKDKRLYEPRLSSQYFNETGVKEHDLEEIYHASNELTYELEDATLRVLEFQNPEFVELNPEMDSVTNTECFRTVETFKSLFDTYCQEIGLKHQTWQVPLGRHKNLAVSHDFSLSSSTPTLGSVTPTRRQCTSKQLATAGRCCPREHCRLLGPGFGIGSATPKLVALYDDQGLPPKQRLWDESRAHYHGVWQCSITS